MILLISPLQLNPAAGRLLFKFHYDSINLRSVIYLLYSFVLFKFHYDSINLV